MIRIVIFLPPAAINLETDWNESPSSAHLDRWEADHGLPKGSFDKQHDRHAEQTE